MNVMITGLKMPKRCPINALIYPDGRAIITLHSGKTMECRAEEAADVRPVVRGKWVTAYDDFMKSNYDTCSCCGKEYFGANGFNYCPNCGADMREKS
ncbi:MAG: hypothetical protein IJI06_08870 [Oscillospiraceae bacterium]|nr:hypothetical protein [Oscillospiraceae bacterium]